MRFMIDAAFVPGADRLERQQEEQQGVRRLRDAGVFVSIWRRLDDTGAFVLAEAESEEGLLAHLETLPYVTDGVMRMALSPVEVV